MKENSSLNMHILCAAEKLSAIALDRKETCSDRPGMKNNVVLLIKHLRSALYPSIFGAEAHCTDMYQTAVGGYLQQATLLLNSILSNIIKDSEKVNNIICAYMDALPDIAQILSSDISAAYEGDPAAKSEDEIMLAYPAFEAISIFRLAHGLYSLGVPLLPRMMTEYAHQLTGIDIHPGACIGSYFFIDHGTGVVIGETCTIGDHVKLYQGVTLGAKSFELDENGNPVKGTKRHPDIGNHVIIYAGATILGGGTSIGDNCVIGGNVWLTHSVEANQTVYYNGK